MEAKRRFTSYDGFKLFVAILLLLGIILSWRSSSLTKDTPPTEVAEVATEEIKATLEPTEEIVREEMPTLEATSEAVEEPTSPELELPPLPEPSDGLSYDADSGFVLSPENLPLYQLDEEGFDWTPIIPEDLTEFQLSSAGEHRWVLIDDQDAPRHYWEFDVHLWMNVPQEQVVAEESTQTEDVKIADCSDTLPPRLMPGEEAKVLVRLNFRSSPGIANDNWLTTMRPGTQLKVLGETVCTVYDFGAYLWWHLEREDGVTGWSAEAPVNGSYYFLEPVE